MSSGLCGNTAKGFLCHQDTGVAKDSTRDTTSVNHKTMTKFFVPLLIFPATFATQLNAQDLMNNSPDTLQQFGRIYYSKFQEKKEFQYTLTEGYYVLIFDHKINANELGFRIKRRHDTPILYQRHNGYFSFEVEKHSVAYLEFTYDGHLKDTGIFAQLYRVAPQIMNTPTKA